MTNLMDEDDLQALMAQSWKEEAARLEGKMDKEVTLSFCGPVSSGKTSAIKALFQIDFGQISPLPGSTTEVKAARLPGHENVWILDTPGLQDTTKALSQAARQAFDRTDLFLYFINAEGSVTEPVAKDYQNLRALGKPVLAVLNKVDLVRTPKEGAQEFLEEFAEHARLRLGAPKEDFLFCAIDPDPRLAPSPINMRQLLRWIVARLEVAGKDVPFVQALSADNKEEMAVLWILAGSAASFAIGALPIPGVDMVPQVALLTGLGMRIASMYNVPMDVTQATSLATALILGSASKVAFRVVIEAMATLPTGATQAIAGGVAAATTLVYGFTILLACKAYQQNGSLVLDPKMQASREAMRRWIQDSLEGKVSPKVWPQVNAAITKLFG